MIALVVMATHAGGCASGGGQRPRMDVAFESEAWSYRGNIGHRLTTPHYEIFTTLRDATLVNSLPEVTEGAFAQYQQLVPSSREPHERMKVYLFATRSEWADFTKRFTGDRASIFLQVRNGGYSERGVSVIQYTAHQTTFPLMSHEGFHQYLYHYVNRNVPAWLNEGVAVAFEGQSWDEKRGTTFDPWLNPSRRNTLSEALLANRTLPLADLLETNAGRVLHKSSRTIGTYYAQLWLLVLFLREGNNGQYAADFQRLLNQLGSPELAQYAKAAHIWSESDRYSYGESLFRSFITEDLPKFEEEYTAFMRQKLLNAQ